MQGFSPVEKFYEEVFEDFKNRLFIAYRFKSTISSEQIDKFSKVIISIRSKIVRQKMHRKQQLFHTGIKLSLQKKSNDNKGEEINNVNNKVKIEHEEDESYNQLSKTVIKDKQEESEESQDDLKAFKQKEQEPVVKVEQPAEKKEEDEENSEELYEEEDRKKEVVLSKCAQKIFGHMIGTYSTKNKKHIPKDQKTKIDLENVFLRTSDREVFYSKMQCDFQQAQYSNIKL